MIKKCELTLPASYIGYQ